MKPRIESFPETRIIGMRVRMSFAANKTRELWSGFMPRLSSIENRVGETLYSMEVYDNPDFFQNFNPMNEFDKWAGVPVKRIGVVPEGLGELLIPAGQYAVFHYKGKPSEAQATFQSIYTEWLPNSGYSLDDRPHMAIMGEKYKGEDPESEEEFWVPVRRKQ